MILPSCTNIVYHRRPFICNVEKGNFMPKRKRKTLAYQGRTAHQLPSGNWRVQVPHGKLPNGKTRYESITRETPEEALEAAHELEQQWKYATGPVLNLCLGDAIDRYIESNAARLAGSTTTGYRRLRKNTLQGIMSIPLKNLSNEIIQTELDKGAATMSPKYLKNAVSLVCAALKRYHPTLWKNLSLSLPAPIPYVPSIPQEDTIRIIFQGIHSSPAEIPILLAMLCGLRSSEIRGLQFQDLVKVPNDNVYGIWIRRAIVDSDQGPLLKQTKTTTSTRLMPLPQMLAERIQAIPHANPDDFITTLSGHAIYHRFVRICQKNGLPHYRLHDLRHLYSSVLLANDVPDFYAKELTGHSSTATLNRVYQHSFLSKKMEFVKKADSFFERLYSCDMSCD